MRTYSLRRLARRTALAAVLGGLAVPGAALAAIVVAASGPSAGEYAVGRKLEATARVTLRQGDTLTVLDEKGTRVLRGPGTFPLSQASAPARTAVFAALTRQRAAGRVRTGAVRDPTVGLTVRSPNLWYVDVARPGKQCIVDPANVRLWRAAADKPAQLRVAGATEATVDFAAGAMVAPVAVPVTDGTGLVIRDVGGSELGRFEFAVLPTQPDDPESLAEALIARGCTAQLELLASSLAPPG
jgi:hypothetical protein